MNTRIRTINDDRGNKISIIVDIDLYYRLKAGIGGKILRKIPPGVTKTQHFATTKQTYRNLILASQI